MLPPHPDRSAETLANVSETRLRAGTATFAAPGAGSKDARIDLKQALVRASLALATRGTEAARARWHSIAGEHLHAGTVRDGVARGVRVAAEETLSLCKPRAVVAGPAPDPLALVSERELRKPREILVASGGFRARWSRKAGFLFVDRESDLHVEDGLRFEDRSDRGTLDAFEAAPGERPRIFSPAFLKPVLVEHSQDRDLLVLGGRLGRRADGYPCELALEGRKDERFLRLRVTVTNSRTDHRLRTRFLGDLGPRIHGLDDVLLGETVQHAHGTFLGVTIVRACGRLAVGNELVDVPEANCLGRVTRTFRIGGAAD